MCVLKKIRETCYHVILQCSTYIKTVTRVGQPNSILVTKIPVLALRAKATDLLTNIQNAKRLRQTQQSFQFLMLWSNDVLTHVTLKELGR